MSFGLVDEQRFLSRTRVSWNVNGLQARLDGIARLVEKYQPDLMCFQKVRKKGAFLTQIPGYMGWLGIIDDGLFGGVSSYIRQGFPFVNVPNSATHFFKP